MNEIVAIAQFVAAAVWQVWPLFLVSIILSVLIRTLKLDGLIRRAFNANAGTAILLATVVGAFSPFCSCTVVPVIAGLLLSGVPLAPIMAFWIASPTMDPEIFTLSVGVLGWPLALARLLATLALSLAAGFITLALTNAKFLPHVLPRREKQPAVVSPSTSLTSGDSISLVTAASSDQVLQQSGVEQQAVLNPAAVSGAGACSVCVGPTVRQKPKWRQSLAATWHQIDWPEFGYEVGRQSWLLGRWLLLAFLIEALITRYIPQAAIASILGEGNIFAIPLAALIGVPLYLSNISALPIVSGLLAQGMLPGAAIAFLIAGPVTTIPAMTAVYGIVQKRLFALYLAIGLLGATLLGYITNIVLA